MLGECVTAGAKLGGRVEMQVAVVDCVIGA